MVEEEEINVSMKKDLKKLEEYLAHCESRKKRVFEAIRREENEIAIESQYRFYHCVTHWLT